MTLPPEKLPCMSTRRDLLATLPASMAGLFLTQCSTTSTAPPPSEAAAGAAPAGPRPPTPYRGKLPLGTTFIGRDKFQALCAKAGKENWASLPLGRRTTTVARALLGTRYGN